MTSHAADAVDRAFRYSPFLRELMAREDGAAVVAATADAARAQAFVPDGNGSLARQLRRARAQTILSVALADLSGAATLEEITSILSDFADLALDSAIEAAIRERVPDATPLGFAVIALGKHGSRELNFSSDIDPIFIFDPATLPRRPREEPGEAAVRVARRVVELLQARDADGYVFRVDLRLRPASEATPIAIPVDAAIAHYESSALAWERAAFVRARAAAGDLALGKRFLDAIAPFVWRRSLDYGAVADLRALTASIRDHHGATPFGPGYDLKRGRGGIREVEFFAQVHQLIHGGRNATLRIGATMPALTSLADAGLIGANDAGRLADAYRLLRTIEHRVQMIDDRQTHMLPAASDDLVGVAQLHGLDGADALLDLLRGHVETVERLYDALDEGNARPAPVAARADNPLFAAFARPGEATAIVERWRAGGARAIRSPAAVTAFEAMLPDLLADLATAPDPDAALHRLDSLLGRLTSGVNLFRLVDAQPTLRVLLVDILSHAPVLADALAQRPALLDRLVDRTALGPVPDIDTLIEELSGNGALETEALLDRVRHIVGEYRFALGVQIVEGTADPIEVAAGYGRIAEAAVRCVTSRIVADFEQVHGRVPGGAFLILALGRFGGGLLTHASDLDLVYLFTGDFAAESEGPKPLGATLYFNRLGQRVTGALSAPTSVGALYEVDTRLRPSGAQGPLVASLDAFERYQRDDAWAWEHMALARARCVYGPSDGVAGVVMRTLSAARDPAKLARDVAAMRVDIAAHKPPNGELDVKLSPGGLVDLEFAVHYWQLARGIGLTPRLRDAIGRLADAGVVDPELLGAHDMLTRMLVVLRLVAPDLAVPEAPTRALVAKACDADDWDGVLARLADARQCVARHWTQIVALAEDEA